MEKSKWRNQTGGSWEKGEEKRREMKGVEKKMLALTTQLKLYVYTFASSFECWTIQMHPEALFNQTM